MLRSEKAAFIADLDAIYSRPEVTILVVHYHGLTVAEITKLRKSLRAGCANFKVVKNTLSKIAAEKVGLDTCTSLFSGPSAIAYSADPVSISKVLVEFASSNEKLKILGGLMNRSLVDADTVHKIAKLPSLEQLRGSILGLLQTPASQLVRVLGSPQCSIVRAINAHIS